MKQVVRNIQTYFPGLQDFKYEWRYVYRKLFSKPCEKDFEGLKLFDIPSDACIIDIGANRGETLQTMKIMLPQSQITAFEPNPIVAAKTAKKF